MKTALIVLVSSVAVLLGCAVTSAQDRPGMTIEALRTSPTLDSYLGLIIPVAFSSFGTFLLRQFFLTIPQSYVDAAKVDGSIPPPKLEMKPLGNDRQKDGLFEKYEEANERKALRLIARTPSFLAMYHRMRTGQEVVPPNPKLPHAANFLAMLLGIEPSPEDTEVIDTTFVLYADHTMNASTFTARIVASTLSDMFSAITAAIAALKGPLHGGANEESMKMLEEVGSPERAEAYVRDRLERHEKVMGFGHAVYKTMDPRATVLKRLSKETGERHGDPRWFEISEAIERTVAEQKGLYPNVDFYAASVYHTLGIPTDLMTPIFAIARMAVWTAHVREQYADNRVIRPGSEYVGPTDRSWAPIERR